MSVVNGEANGGGLPPEGEAASSAEAPVAVDDNDDVEGLEQLDGAFAPVDLTVGEEGASA